MSGAHLVFDPTHLYFITSGAAGGVRIFARDVVKRIIADSLDYMRVHSWITLYCFVIMPNHVHFIVRCHEDHPVKDIIREFKKHTSKQIIRQYQAEDNRNVLAFLEKAAQGVGGQKFKVWEEGYDARDIFTPGFLRQKLEYVHNNPCQPHWQLVERPEDYVWSSARFYLLGEPAVIAVDNA